MNNRDKYLAALDIGSSKICCIIASRDQYDMSKIIGLGYNEAKGISHGIISDFNAAIESISSAIFEAEKQADLKINEINISASSKVVDTKLFNQKINILEDRIKQDDINESLNLVMQETYFSEKKILHAAPIGFSIDGANGIKNPLGMYGSELEVEFVISTIGSNHYKNYVECVTKCNVDIGQVVFSGLASGIAVLNDNELDLGAIVLEIGATKTSLSIFAKGNFLFSEIINFGGNNITEAIAKFFGISFTEAEKIKIMHASAIEHNSDSEISFEVPSLNFNQNENFINISKKDLHGIVKPFIEDILKWTDVVIGKSGYKNIISKQLVITGGGSQLDGITILAKNKLNYNSRIGFPREFKSNLENNLDPGYSVALGIIQSIFKVKEYEKKQNFNTHMTKKNKFSFVKNWMSEIFFNNLRR